ncbi:MAG: hypothetical protein R2771_02965 [Saprospiraceae bacterium]
MLGFFAHYDVLVQRPSQDQVVATPMDYYYLNLQVVLLMQIQI